MIHTDKYFSHPVVLKATSHLDDFVTIDTCYEIEPLSLDRSGSIGGTFLKVVSYVSNDAAIYTPHSSPIDA